MLVLNLCCAHGHPFEGWFGSHEDFKSQQERGLLSCPVCSNDTITRLPSAPRLNVSHLRGERERQPDTQAPCVAGGSPETPPAAPDATPGPSSAGTASEGSPLPPALLAQQAQWLRAVAHVIKHSEDVGQQFAEEARRIHYGEAPQRAIRGSASSDDAAALIDEGIDVLPLPLPAAIKGPLQ